SEGGDGHGPFPLLIGPCGGAPHCDGWGCLFAPRRESRWPPDGLSVEGRSGVRTSSSLRQPGDPEETLWAHGFASPPHDGFAIIEDEETSRNARVSAAAAEEGACRGRPRRENDQGDRRGVPPRCHPNEKSEPSLRPANHSTLFSGAGSGRSFRAGRARARAKSFLRRELFRRVLPP